MSQVSLGEDVRNETLEISSREFTTIHKNFKKFPSLYPLQGYFIEITNNRTFILTRKYKKNLNIMEASIHQKINILYGIAQALNFLYEKKSSNMSIL